MDNCVYSVLWTVKDLKKSFLLILLFSHDQSMPLGHCIACVNPCSPSGVSDRLQMLHVNSRLLRLLDNIQYYRFKQMNICYPTKSNLFSILPSYTHMQKHQVNLHTNTLLYFWVLFVAYTDDYIRIVSDIYVFLLHSHCLYTLLPVPQ